MVIPNTDAISAQNSYNDLKLKKNNMGSLLAKNTFVVLSFIYSYAGFSVSY